MSKLSVANLVRTVRALGDTKGASSHSQDLIGENFWRLTADADSSDARISAGDLSAAIREVFDANQDRMVFDQADATWRLLRQPERLLRFDPEHHGAVSPDAIDLQVGRDAGGKIAPESAKSAIIKGLGAVQARETLGQRHWVVVFVNADTPSVELPLCQLQQLNRCQRLLILWCEEQTEIPPEKPQPSVADRSPTAAVFEQLSNEPDLICLGPIGGLGVDGVVAVLDALKALERPAVLYLRLRRDVQPIEPGDEHAIPAGSGAATNGLATNGAAANGHPTNDHSESDADHADQSGRAPASGFTETAAPAARLAVDLAAESLARLAESDRRIVGVDAVGSAAWATAFAGAPQRFFQASAEEADAMTWCAGLAEGGCHPFVLLSEAALARWCGRAAEEIGDLRPPVTFVICSAHQHSSSGLDRAGGLSLLPNTVLMTPSHAAELDQMLCCAAAQQGPAAIWLPRMLSEEAIEPSSPRLEAGRAARLKSGADLALLALGEGVTIALEAARELERHGVASTVLNLRFARPLDGDAILAAVSEATAAVLIDHEVSYAAAALEILSSHGVEQPLAVLGPGDPRDACDPVERRRRIDRAVDRGLKLLETAAPAMILATSESSFSEQRAAAAQAPLSLYSAQQERDQILALRLTPAVQAWIEEYAEIGERGLYLWRWCLHGVRLTTLPCVPGEWRDDACDTKFLSGMLNVLLDDVSDQWRNGDLLDELLKVTAGGGADFGRFSPEERRYAELTCRLWNVFWERVRKYPCFEAYQELLRYDLTQLFNTVRYSHLVNNNLSLLNVIEHDHYSSQGMGLMSFSTVDLMCSGRFPCQDLAALREVMWHAQWMARIGNLVTTWQREIGDRDYTSGVFARAVGRRELTLEQLQAGDADEIEAAIRRGEHENYFLRRWNYHRDRLRLMRPRFQAFDLNLVIQGLERLLLTEFGSRGRK